MRDILEPLLGGQFFCRHSTPAPFARLCDKGFAHEVDAALRPLGRSAGRWARWVTTVNPPPFSRATSTCPIRVTGWRRRMS